MALRKDASRHLFLCAKLVLPMMMSVIAASLTESVTSTGIGDYIAAGIGDSSVVSSSTTAPLNASSTAQTLARSLDSTAQSAASYPPGSSSHWQNTTELRSFSYSNSSVIGGLVSETSTGAASQDMTASLSEHISTSTSQSPPEYQPLTSSNTTAYIGLTSVPVASGSFASSVNGSGIVSGVFTNITYDGNCWSQWNEYWNASYTESSISIMSTYTATGTLFTSWTYLTGSETATLTTTSTMYDGPYAVSQTTITTIVTGEAAGQIDFSEIWTSTYTAITDMPLCKCPGVENAIRLLILL